MTSMQHQANDTLNQVAEFVSSERLDGSGGQWLIDCLEEAHGYELGAILVFNPALGRLEPLALSRQGQDEQFLEKDKALVGDALTGGLTGITGWVMRTGEAIRSGNVQRDSRYRSLRDDIKSELCVPLKILGRTVGVINTETRRSEAYTELDERLLKTVGTLAAGALEAQHSTVHEVAIQCAVCRKLRTDETSWQEVPAYLFSNFGTTVSHGLCPVCALDEMRKLEDEA